MVAIFRPLDNWTWGQCRLDFGFAYILKICFMELKAQNQPHTEGWDNISSEIPPIEFIRSMYGATELDKLSKLIREDTTPFDWQNYLDL